MSTDDDNFLSRGVPLRGAASLFVDPEQHAIVRDAQATVIRGLCYLQRCFRRIQVRSQIDESPLAAIRCQNAILSSLTAAGQAYLALHGRQVGTTHPSLGEALLGASGEAVNDWLTDVAHSSTLDFTLHDDC